jgi:hypothetical protein
MRGWWQCPSGLGSDLRWVALSLAARGLLATFADAADGTGEVFVGAIPVAAVVRAAAPGETPEARDALWSELTAAGFLALDGDVVRVRLPGGGDRVALVSDDVPAEEAPREAQVEPQGVARGRKHLQAWSSRYGLKTPAQRAAWVAGKGAKRVAGMDPAVVAAWVSGAGRRGGLLGAGRTETTPGDNTETTPETTRDNVVSADGDNTPSPSHSPSGEKDKEKEGLGARADGDNARRQHRDNTPSLGDNAPETTRDNVVSVGGDNTPGAYDRDGVETALVGASGGKVDLMSAPAHLLRDLHRVMGEMRVTPALARVMGELARDPAAMWKRATPVRRVTPQFLLGWVEGNGERDARALSELVAAAREKVLARAPRAVPAASTWNSEMPPRVSPEEEAAARRRWLEFGQALKAASAARKAAQA